MARSRNPMPSSACPHTNQNRPNAAARRLPRSGSAAASPRRSAARRLSCSASSRGRPRSPSRSSSISATSAKARKCARCRSRSASVSPAACSRSCAYSRIVSSIRYRTTPPVSVATISDWSTSRPTATSTSGPSSDTAVAASMSKPPAKTESLRNRTRSGSASRSWLQVRDASRERCRSATSRGPPVSSRNRSSSRSAMSPADTTRTHAAASSMASGMPSSRSQTARSAAPPPV